MKAWILIMTTVKASNLPLTNLFCWSFIFSHKGIWVASMLFIHSIDVFLKYNPKPFAAGAECIASVFRCRLCGEILPDISANIAVIFIAVIVCSVDQPSRLLPPTLCPTPRRVNRLIATMCLIWNGNFRSPSYSYVEGVPNVLLFIMSGQLFFCLLPFFFGW